MATKSEIAQRWMDRALGRADRDLNAGRYSNVYYQGDSIFSYGSHFEMARVMRDRNERPTFVLMNADRYSPTTTQHQSMVRGVVSMSGLPSILIPYSALAGAGIIRNSIRPIDIREDRTVTHEHSSEETPNGPYTLMDDPNGATEPKMVWAHTAALGYTQVERMLPVQVSNPNRRYLTNRPGEHRIAEYDQTDGLWHWTTTQHFLGDSLFYARSNGRRGKRKFLSSFDYQESRNLYFLCELPHRCPADTVEDAIEALKPEPVKLAEEAGLEPTRQGDIFAIPTELTTKEVKKLGPWGKAKIVKRPHVLGTNHTATNVIFATQGRVYARGVLYHEPGRFREPDHARRKMGDGKTWHLLMRNTVPRAPEGIDPRTGRPIVSV